jgi:virginiamycin B lyase
VFGRRLAGHSHHSEHPLRRRVLLTILGAALLAALLLLIAPRTANGNFVYWANATPADSVGRAKINGTGLNNALISGLDVLHGVTIDSKYIYWTEGDGSASRIGRANLDGSGVNRNFIPNSAGVDFGPIPPAAIAVTGSAIYWHNSGTQTIGRANIDGTAPNPTLINPMSSAVCGIAADQSFVYWLVGGMGNRIGRANADGSNPIQQFISVSGTCGLAADNSFLYWGAPNQSIGRAPVGGGTANDGFIPGATSAPNSPCGVAVNSQYVFWATGGTADSIGRANIGGGAPNPSLIGGLNEPCLPAAAPSNKITVNSVKKKKKKGTATIDAKVPGPGQVTLNQTSAPPDVNAVEAGVKQVGLTITQASSFKLAVKPTGKTAKKLNKQVKKQLRKKRKAKAKASVTVFVHFVPAGVAGVPNTERLKVTLIKQRKKKK